MKRLPSMQTLLAFEAAARHQNYSAAAEELRVTHGAISHRIRELESQFGATLFRRSGRSMIPTRIAVTLLAPVREALAMIARAVPDDARATSDRLVIGVHPSLAIRWLVPRLGSFMRDHPGLAVEVRSTADLGDFLNQGVDVAIRYGAGEWPNAAREHLAGEVLFPVCTPAYRDLHRIRRPADLARCTLLTHAWQPWTPWFRAARLRLAEPVAGLLLSDSGMLMEAALAGEGVALARQLFARDDLTRGRLVAPFDLSIEDTYAYYLIWHPGTPIASKVAWFRDWLRDQLKSDERSDTDGQRAAHARVVPSRSSRRRRTARAHSG
jgi:LysR family transcriptional regulator, glycine cleavage system transcriptional activator